MNKLGIIIKREYLTKVRNRTFIIMTFVSPLIFVGLATVIYFLTSSNSSDDSIYGIVGDTAGLDLRSIDDVQFTALDPQADYTDYLSTTSNLDAVLDLTSLADPVLYSKQSPSLSLVGAIENRIGKTLTAQSYQSAGYDMAELDALKRDVDVRIINETGRETSRAASGIKAIFGGAAGYLLMMFIIIYGNMVMRSVIEEKVNRIIEIIISSVKPTTLMFGKIAGTTLAGLTQFGIWVILGGVLFTVASTFIGVPLPGEQAAAAGGDLVGNREVGLAFNEILSLPLANLVSSFLIYFLLGYLLYASIYVTIGAAVDSETDTQQFMLPVILPLILAIYVGFFSVLDDPHGIVAVTFSYIPLTSPIVMLMRIPFGVAWWEVLLSIAILSATIFIVVQLAARVYKIGILSYGNKASWAQVLKWIRSS